MGLLGEKGVLHDELAAIAAERVDIRLNPLHGEAFWHEPFSPM